jgi:ElaB/YqjD/DUF883 family membrane-anchored ribosome-binding protein
MAKRRSGKTVRGAAADRFQGGGTRRTTGGGSKRGSTSKRGSHTTPPSLDVTGGGRGMLSGARNVAEKVGKTTMDAAQNTMETARGWAAGAAGAAGSVASRAGETASQVAGKVRENPWPSLLIGAGATWLAIDAIRGRSEEESGSRGTRQRRGSSRQERGAVGQAMSKVADAGRAAGGSIEEFVRERPLLAGAATLGLGVAVGMAMPSSVTENEMFGETRDKLVGRARDAARGTIDKVRDVAESIERIGPFGSGSSSRGGSRGGSRG